MVPNIFISHASADKGVADKVIFYLESHSQRCWIAPRDIPPGADWAVSIIDGIDGAQWMVLILSDKANRSPQVRREIERAVSRGISIIILLIEKVELSKSMQYYLSTLPVHDIAETSLEDKLPEILKIIDTEFNGIDDSSDLSNLSSLLEDDLNQLSLCLDTGSEETIRLLPGERRRVSVLHINTGFSRSELPGSVQNTLFRTIDNLVERLLKNYGGYLDRNEEGCYQCVFGLKRAFEDDDHRAISCGIRLFKGFSELNTVLRKKGFSIDFGLGVASGMLSVEQTETDNLEPYGKVLTVAKRLSTTASNELLSSQSVYKTSKDQFSWELHSDGVYRITDYSTTTSQLKILSIHSLFVGRTKEIARLEALLEKQKTGVVKNHQGGSKHIVLGIKGEAGIGKSRLVHEFVKRNCEGEDYIVLKGQTLSYAQPPYWLWTILLRNLLGITPGSSITYDEFLALLDNINSEEKLIKSAPFLSKLLSINSEDDRLENLDNRTIALEIRIALRNLLQALSNKKKLIVVLEDLHWMDTSDQTVFEFVVDNCCTETPIVFLLLYRPEREDGSAIEFDIRSSSAMISEIQIAEVDDEACVSLVEGLLKGIGNTGSVIIKPAVEQFLLNRSRGNPFYLEELVLDLVESGTLASQENEWKFTKSMKNVFVPESLTGLLQSRLDRLPDSWRGVLQFSSVLGMEFQFQLLLILAGKVTSNMDILHGLDGLERKQMLLSEKNAFDGKYLFRHMLVHDTAYSSILEENLEKLHRAAAESIEETFEDQMPAVLCYHWEKAANIPKAIEWGMKALQQSIRDYSNNTALKLCDKLEYWLSDTDEFQKLYQLLGNKENVLNLLGRREEQGLEIEKMITIAEKAESPEWMVDSLLRKGELLQTIGQMDEALVLFRKALELADSSFQGQVLRTLGVLQENLGHMDLAQDLFQKSLMADRKTGNRASEGITLGNLGVLYYHQGRMTEARDLFEKVLYMQTKSGNRAGKGIALGNLAIVQHKLGRIDEARSFYKKALEIHREIGNRSDEGIVLGNIGAMHHQLGHWDEARKHFEKALEIFREIGDCHPEGSNLLNFGSLYLDQGRISEARKLFENALQIANDIGYSRLAGHVLVKLGTLCLDLNQFETAEKYFKKALVRHRMVGNHWHEGMTLADMGKLYAHQGNTEKAREYFEKGLKIARILNNKVNEWYILGNLGLLDLEEGHQQRAYENYQLAERIISEIQCNRENYREFFNLRKKLLLTDYSATQVPWPAHWGIPEETAEAASQVVSYLESHGTITS